MTVFRSNHTPGPWQMACDSYGKVQHSRKYDCVFTTVKGEGGDRLVSIAARIENSKDAVLISAAPDLLVCLCDLVETIRDGRDPTHGQCLKAETAIAKALNRQVRDLTLTTY